MIVLAEQLDKEMMSTSDFLVEKKIDLNSRINFESFCNIMTERINLDLKECAELFEELDQKARRLCYS